ncbi:MAG: TRAP transporter small permease subunit [Alphaproteobacteria bacterium]|nr:TRAP transporter small permease subunit [Alphaproteobacteria bacterium]
MRFLGRLKGINDVLERVVRGLGGALIAVILFALFASAATRYVTGIGYDWLTELPPQLLPWIVFPMIGVLLRHDGHVTVDVLPHFLHGRNLTRLRAVVFAFSTLACLAFAIFGVDAVGFYQRLGQRTATEVEIPLWLLYLSFPIGFFMAASFTGEALLRLLVRREGDAPVAAPGGRA